MKMKLFGLAFIAMSIISMPVVAQTTTDKAEVKKEHVKQARKEMKKGGNLFEGITLTDAQKEQFKQLRETRKAEGEARRQEKQRKDSTARADRKVAKKAYLDNIKTILTPDQYVIFLENVYLYSSPEMGAPQGVSKMKGQKRNHEKK